MIIRKIEEKEVEAVSRLLMRNFDGEMKKYHSKEVIAKFKTHNTPEKLRQQMYWKEILIATENDEIVATGAIANFGDSDNPKYSVSNLFVKPELHKTGIGRMMFESLYKIFLDKDASALHVPSSRNAVGFYRKLGFTIDELQQDEADEITWMTMRV